MTSMGFFGPRRKTRSREDADLALCGSASLREMPLLFTRLRLLLGPPAGIVAAELQHPGRRRERAFGVDLPHRHHGLAPGLVALLFGDGPEKEPQDPLRGGRGGGGVRRPSRSLAQLAGVPLLP